MAVFDWATTVGAALEREPRIRKIDFGDGYAQRSRNGLNCLMQRWSLGFNSISNETKTMIDAFLSARGGVESFDWTPPGELVAHKYVCEKWSITAEDTLRWAIRAEFQQVPM